MTLNNKVYNFIKYLITVFLPAVGTLYWLLVETWDFPRIAGVNGTINAVITFLGLLIGYSTRQYNKTEGAPDGDLIVTQDGDETYLGLGVNKSLNELTGKDTVRLTVVDKGSIKADEPVRRPFE